MLTKPERYPDLLRERAGTYFEAHGFCFAPMLETTPAGACELAVYFQNRYAGQAFACVQVLPPARAFGLRRHLLPARALAVACPGGAFGVARVPFPIPAAYQGHRVHFQLGATVRYPQGRGELLRFRAGVRVASPAGGSALNHLLAAIAKRPTLSLTLPQGVAETSGADDAVSAELIWWPKLLEAEAHPLPSRLAA